MNFIAWIIIACEIAFWVVIITGLIFRYMLRMERLGFFLLVLTPLIDLILLTITGIDLYRGAVATSAHGISAVYIGVSVVFGKSMIAWSDERFRYYITKQGDKPLKRYGLDYAQHYLSSWFKHLIAFIIGLGCLYGLIYISSEPEKTQALSSTIQWWSRIVIIDLLIAIAYFIWPRKAPEKNA